MRILGTIIRTLIVDVLSRQAEGSNGNVIGPDRNDKGKVPRRDHAIVTHLVKGCCN